MKNLSKFTLFLFFLVFSLFTITRAVTAQVPPPRVPCDPNAVEDPEFNSLRPYQASPCGGDGKIGYFCGNKIIIKEEKQRKLVEQIVVKLAKVFIIFQNKANLTGKI